MLEIDKIICLENNKCNYGDNSNILSDHFANPEGRFTNRYLAKTDQDRILHARISHRQYPIISRTKEVDFESMHLGSSSNHDKMFFTKPY